jgi:hypothetical protein
MNLYSLSAQYQRIMANIMDNDEISAECMEELLSVSDSLEEKIINRTAIVKTLDAKAEAIAKAIDCMKDRWCKLNDSANRLREEIKKEMLACDKKKIEDAYHIAQVIPNNPKVNILDKNILPFKYLREKITHSQEPDKLAMLDDLKAGIEIPGAMLVRENRLQIK